MDKEVLKKFDEFAEELKKGKKIIVLHDTDADGTSAGIVCAKAVKKIARKAEVVEEIQAHVKGELTLDTLERIKALKPDFVIITDLSFDQHPENMLKLKEFAKVAYIDHHPSNADLNSENFLYIKSEMLSDIEPSLYNSSKLCYDLFSRKCSLKEDKWIAAVGIVGDYCTKAWKEFVEEAARESNSSLQEFGKISSIIGSVESLSKNKVKEIYRFLLKAENPKEVLDSEFAKAKQEVDKEIKKAIEGFETNNESFPEKEVMFYELKSHFDISAVVSSIVSFKNIHKTIFIFQKSDGIMKMSIRRQDGKVKVNDLVKKAAARFEGARGGGHSMASGGAVEEKDLKEFKKAVLEEVEEQAKELKE